VKSPSRGPMTSRELVDAVAASGLADDDDSLSFPDDLRRALREERRLKLRAFLADLGFDPLDWIRARRDVKMADPDADW
jgi:hypothetical protein